MSRPFTFLTILSCLLLCSCHKTDNSTTVGSLCINFQTVVDGSPLAYDLLDYVNAAGNRYEVNEVKYFISRVQFHKSDGTVISVSNNNGIHYFDSDIPSTHNWLITDELSKGKYDSISFVMGLDEQQNVTGFFVNPPETNFAWPDILGGGYHYMQINGRWVNTNDSIRPFNLHTGIGQLWEGGVPTQYIHNYFRVTLPLNSLEISAEKTSTIQLSMNVNEWFRSPQVYDLNVWGGAIMQNQQAQEVLKANGRDVFSVAIQ